MKKSRFKNYLVIPVVILLYFCSCDDSNKTDRSQNTDATLNTADPMLVDSIIAAARKWHSVDSLSEIFIKKVDSLKHLSLPIREEVGQAYMTSYKNNLGQRNDTDKALGVILSRESLAFYIKYILEDTSRQIVAAYGRYDLHILQERDLIDGNLQRERNYDKHHGLIMGAKSERFVNEKWKDTFYVKPFELGKVKFYDDWHNGWPPPIIDSTR